MIELESHGNRRLARWLRDRPRIGAVIGYSVLATGAVILFAFACRAWKPQSDDNPLVVLLLLWLTAGISHSLWRFWPACMISAAGSALGYVVVALILSPDPFMNEMFGAGIIEEGLFGLVLSMLMGTPVAIYRRIRNAGPEERTSE